MKWFGLFLLGVVPLIWGAMHILDGRQEAMTVVTRFCDATHGGEPWTHVLERAPAVELEFIRANASTEKNEEWLAWKDAFAIRVGCRITVSKGLVVATKVGVLPTP